MTSLRTRQRLVRRLQQVGIHNQMVLDVMLNTPRHLFVDEALASHAYDDTALPIGFGQTISQPYIVARMTEALLREPSLHKALEIGTGSAYQTAVLAQLFKQVYSVERIGKLLERAKNRLRALGLSNVFLKHGDGSLGWPEYGPFDAIIVTAASPQVPATLLQQLTVGGVLVIPIGTPNGQQLIRVERKSCGLVQQDLGPVSFVPLLGGVR